jgi:hypothetical protein
MSKKGYYESPYDAKPKGGGHRQANRGTAKHLRVYMYR